MAKRGRHHCSDHDNNCESESESDDEGNYEGNQDENDDRDDRDGSESTWNGCQTGNAGGSYYIYKDFDLQRNCMDDLSVNDPLQEDNIIVRSNRNNRADSLIRSSLPTFALSPPFTISDRTDSESKITIPMMRKQKSFKESNSTPCTSGAQYMEPITRRNTMDVFSIVPASPTGDQSPAQCFAKERTSPSNLRSRVENCARFHEKLSRSMRFILSELNKAKKIEETSQNMLKDINEQRNTKRKFLDGVNLFNPDLALGEKMSEIEPIISDIHHMSRIVICKKKVLRKVRERDSPSQRRISQYGVPPIDATRGSILSSRGVGL